MPERLLKLCLSLSGNQERLENFSPSTLSECVEFSRPKVNQRPSYQIGCAASWSAAERALYAERALPLEDEIYG